jgi:hypothetical protein
MLEQNAILDPGIPSAVQQAQQTKNERILALAKTYQSVFRSELGQIVLNDLRRRVKKTSSLAVNQINGMVDPMLTSYGLGASDLVAHILDQMQLASDYANIPDPNVSVKQMSTFDMMYNQQPI